MIPAPGFQKPIPYLLEIEARKSYTSHLLQWQLAGRSLPQLLPGSGDRNERLKERQLLSGPPVMKLQQRHLSCSILHGYPVRCKINIIFSPGICLGRMPDKYANIIFFLKESAACPVDFVRRHFFREFAVNFLNEVEVEYHIMRF